jgi:hypothetical protein
LKKKKAGVFRAENVKSWEFTECVLRIQYAGVYFTVHPLEIWVSFQMFSLCPLKQKTSWFVGMYGYYWLLTLGQMHPRVSYWRFVILLGGVSRHNSWECVTPNTLKTQKAGWPLFTPESVSFMG